MAFQELSVYIEQKDCQFYHLLVSDISSLSNTKLIPFQLLNSGSSVIVSSGTIILLWNDVQIHEKQKYLLETYPEVPYVLLLENIVEGDDLSSIAHPTKLFLLEKLYSKDLLRLMLDFAERIISDMTRSFEFDRVKARIDVLENVFEESLDILIQIDPSSKLIVGLNRQALSALEYESGDLLAKDFSILLPPVVVDEDTQFEGNLIAGNSLITKNGKIIPTESSFRLYSVHGKMAIWATFRDITERQEAQERVKKLKAFYEFILDKIDSDISVLDDKFRYEYSNPVLVPDVEIRKWLIQKTDYDFGLRMSFPSEFAEKRKKYLEIASKENEIVQFEELLHEPNDEKKYLLRKYIPIEDDETKKKRIISYGIDITERKIAEERISYLAYYDSLTGLANRTLFLDHANQVFKNFKSSDDMIGVYFFDIDNFKFINDSLGHAKGDMLLQMVAARLKRFMTEVDTVARFGGDEFAILKVDVKSQEDSIMFANKILDMLSQPFHITGRDLYTTISIGIAMSPKDGTSIQDLLKNADMAMYKAKELGKHSFRFYSPELIERSERRLSIEINLRKAIHNKELSLFFQPQVSMKTGKICGAEALIRWKHPGRGWISPSEFIPVAEDSGIIERIGDWVLEEACRHKKIWKASGLHNFSVSINVSGKQLNRNDWAQKVQATIERFGIYPDEIELELTESSIMENPEKSIEAFRYLSSLGIKVSIDDFGTGYSSLSYLKKINPDILKIDRSFVIDLEQNEDDQEICRAIINMAVSLKMEVIAEGVETEVQRDLLKSFGCHIIQGYFYSVPLASDDFVKFLKNFDG